MVFNTVEWFGHLLITVVFFLSKKSPWRWPHDGPKHVGDDNTIKLKFICWSLMQFMHVINARNTELINAKQYAFTWTLHGAEEPARTKRFTGHKDDSCEPLRRQWDGSGIIKYNIKHEIQRWQLLDKNGPDYFAGCLELFTVFQNFCVFLARLLSKLLMMFGTLASRHWSELWNEPVC